MSDKKDFTARARQQLEDWDYQLDRLSARLNDLRDEWRGEAQEKLNDMKSRRSEFEEKLERLESHGDDAWGDIKAGLDIAWDGLKTGFLAAKSEFEDNKKH